MAVYEEAEYLEIAIDDFVNKLVSYLKQDVLRYVNSSIIFKDNEYTSTMSTIRNAMLVEEKSIQEIFNFDELLNKIDHGSLSPIVADDESESTINDELQNESENE